MLVINSELLHFTSGGGGGGRRGERESSLSFFLGQNIKCSLLHYYHS